MIIDAEFCLKAQVSRNNVYPSERGNEERKKEAYSSENISD